ncbi:hypothetical protein CO046_02690 [Candidatus Peregrinibacteria bacterium CG_4_9_14_0_2_um_filter_53_11]|nr:MAG: hypothetical protein CO046_02690 [Candidatus Peregrinibacteria bacterium CG_4_9_14_0_2_um_filter_53_11]
MSYGESPAGDGNGRQLRSRPAESAPPQPTLESLAAFELGTEVARARAAQNEARRQELAAALEEEKTRERTVAMGLAATTKAIAEQAAKIQAQLEVHEAFQVKRKEIEARRAQIAAEREARREREAHERARAAKAADEERRAERLRRKEERIAEENRAVELSIERAINAALAEVQFERAERIQSARTRVAQERLRAQEAAREAVVRIRREAAEQNIRRIAAMGGSNISDVQAGIEELRRVLYGDESPAAAHWTGASGDDARSRDIEAQITTFVGTLNRTPEDLEALGFRVKEKVNGPRPPLPRPLPPTPPREERPTRLVHPDQLPWDSIEAADASAGFEAALRTRLIPMEEIDPRVDDE